MNRRRVGSLSLLAQLSGIYAWKVRPAMLTWGATEDEMKNPYPGAELIPGGTRTATMATTLDAPPSKVWPWLIQMGYGRAGWYSWDHLDNLGRPSAERVHPEWQNVHVGDYTDSQHSWQVAALEPERFLGLRGSHALPSGHWYDPSGPRPRYFTDSLWGFLLEELPNDRTRLVVSGYWAMRPKWPQLFLSFFTLEPAHWIMQTRQFANLERRLTEQKRAESRTTETDNQAQVLGAHG